LIARSAINHRMPEMSNQPYFHMPEITNQPDFRIPEINPSPRIRQTIPRCSNDTHRTG
jgi:hypothetical protein